MWWSARIKPSWAAARPPKIQTPSDMVNERRVSGPRRRAPNRKRWSPPAAAGNVRHEMQDETVFAANTLHPNPPTDLNIGTET